MYVTVNVDWDSLKDDWERPNPKRPPQAYFRFDKDDWEQVFGRRVRKIMTQQNIKVMRKGEKVWEGDVKVFGPKANELKPYSRGRTQPYDKNFLFETGDQISPQDDTGDLWRVPDAAAAPAPENAQFEGQKSTVVE